MEERCVTYPLSYVGLEVLKHEETLSALCSALQGKFGCTIVFPNLEKITGSSSVGGKKKIVPQIMYSKKLNNGVYISVQKDDLTTHIADAVVNAANENLSHGAGLAWALSKAGGPDINKSSQYIIGKFGKVQTGNAVLGSAGNLPCKNIIHAVGPRVSSNAAQHEIQNASVLLKKAIFSILNITDKENLKSVAIPAISSGIFNFPLKICADVIVKTVRSYSNDRKSGDKTIEVRLVNNDDLSVLAMENACKEHFGASDYNMSAAVQTRGQAPTQSVLPSLVLGNMIVFLKRGSIEDERADVIVNITGPDLDLTKGFVSFALLGRAGKKMQQDLKQLKSWKTNASLGKVFETSGYALNCKAVFHAVCDTNTNLQMIYTVVKECLQKASGKNFSSISFPAIGTGKLGLQKDEVAHTMIKAMKDFVPHCHKNMNINMVIFPKDVEISRAFEKEMASTQKQPEPGMLSNTNSSLVSQDNVEEKTYFILCGNSKVALDEAESYSLNILSKQSNKVTISNNHVAYLDQVHHAKLAKIQATYNVAIKEFFDEGKSGIIINGDSVNVSKAALVVEQMLCVAQDQFAAIEEKEINHWHPPGFHEQRVNIDAKSPEYFNATEAFKKSGLWIEKVEKIDNPALKKIFEVNEKLKDCKVRTLYQRVNAQFCNLICKVGFQREYAPPKEQKFGAGIYFTTNVCKAKDLWPDSEDLYVYIIIAKVLTGKTTTGSPDLILPPPIGSDPLQRYDSLTSIQNDIYVIFNGQQALPEFIITCRKAMSTHV